MPCVSGFNEFYHPGRYRELVYARSKFIPYWSALLIFHPFVSGWVFWTQNTSLVTWMSWISVPPNQPRVYARSRYLVRRPRVVPIHKGRYPSWRNMKHEAPAYPCHQTPVPRTLGLKYLWRSCTDSPSPRERIWARDPRMVYKLGVSRVWKQRGIDWCCFHSPYPRSKQQIG